MIFLHSFADEEISAVTQEYQNFNWPENVISWPKPL